MTGTNEPLDEAPVMDEAIRFVRDGFAHSPRVALVLGSGLGDAATAITDPQRLPYDLIPGFPTATVPGHRGALVAGSWAGVEVAALQGRFHLYEGVAAGTALLPLRILRAIGAEILVVTNAAGGIDPGLHAGDLMLITDHINLMFKGPPSGLVSSMRSPCRDLPELYDRELRSAAADVAAERGIPLGVGVYAGVLGPSFETPAEIRMLARMGAQAVGMSTVLEVIAARAMGMRVLGISCITNTVAGPRQGKLTHEEVLAVGAEASGRLAGLLTALMPRICTRGVEGLTELVNSKTD
jgi:purine-nucleoside phosphorylase